MTALAMPSTDQVTLPCSETDPEWLFLADDDAKRAANNGLDPARLPLMREAKQLCGGCPVRGACLDLALENRESHGVWGGMSTPERDALIAADVRARKAVAKTGQRARARAGGQVETLPGV